MQIINKKIFTNTNGVTIIAAACHCLNLTAAATAVVGCWLSAVGCWLLAADGCLFPDCLTANLNASRYRYTNILTQLDWTAAFYCKNIIFNCRYSFAFLLLQHTRTYIGNTHSFAFLCSCV